MERKIIKFSGRVRCAKALCSKCYRMVDDYELYMYGGICRRCKERY